jgi:formylglycine-generating enzyme
MRAYSLFRAAPPILLAVVACGLLQAGCKRKEFTRRERPAAELPKATPIASEIVARPGMVFVPAGILKAGTPPGSTPRLADAEMPGSPVPLEGFYIDKYPFPNEPGAIAQTSISRDEAQKACGERGKRLCTELEWERACKGPQNTAYEYGGGYRANACGLGVAVDRSARRPTAEHPQCKSEFGVFDLHGGALEWTDSVWARATAPLGNPAGVGGDTSGRGGNEPRVLAVVRGGNGAPGDVVGRCANASARLSNARHATVGFRCCAGTRNDDEVAVSIAPAAQLQRVDNVAEVTEPVTEAATTLWGSPETAGSAYEFSRAWIWRPVPNEELLVTVGCERKGGPWARCGLVVARVLDSHATLLAQAATGNHLGDLLKGDDALHLRIRSNDQGGTLARDIAYSYGRIVLAEEARP